MTAKIAHRHRPWYPIVLLAITLFPLSAYSQTTLTGAIQFSTNSTGAIYGGQLWNTLGGDSPWDLWLARNPDATSPLNGPADSEAGIAIPLQVGSAHTLYIFGQGGTAVSFNGLNLFFDGNNATPGISVFGAINNSVFLPNSSTTTTLEGTSVAGSGSSFYNSAGAVVVLTGYNWNSAATPPGDVCQAKSFSPGAGPDLFGSFTLQVFPAATLALTQGSGAPFTPLTFTGSGFAPNETIDIFGGHVGAPPVLASATADGTGSFSVAAREPQRPLGPLDVYALGVSSHKLGATTLSVTPALAANPSTGAPGATTTAYVYGFGAGEVVDVYWNEPRQLLGTATANSLGTGSLTIAIPLNAVPGVNEVIGVGQTSKAIGFVGVNVGA